MPDPSPDATRALIHRHWALANARDWDAFAGLLDPGLVYEVPQTRERSTGADGYLDLFCTWPQPWHAVVQQVVADAGRAVCVIDFVAGDTHSTGIGIFEVDDGRITRVTDFWPEPYDPPPRATAHLRRDGRGPALPAGPTATAEARPSCSAPA